MRVKDLTKQYDGKTVVDSVSFEIPRGGDDQGNAVADLSGGL